jgi:hypothetical protein
LIAYFTMKSCPTSSNSALVLATVKEKLLTGYVKSPGFLTFAGAVAEDFQGHCFDIRYFRDIFIRSLRWKSPRVDCNWWAWL